MLALDLVSVEPAHRSRAARAVKDAMKAAGMPTEAALTAAVNAVTDAIVNGRQLLICEEPGVVERAQVEDAHAALGSPVGFEVELYERDPHAAVAAATEPVESIESLVGEELAQSVPPDFMPCLAATRILPLLLSLTDGDAQMAYFFAMRLAIVSGHPNVYIDVCRALAASYGVSKVQR